MLVTEWELECSTNLSAVNNWVWESKISNCHAAIRKPTKAFLWSQVLKFFVSGWGFIIFLWHVLCRLSSHEMHKLPLYKHNYFVTNTLKLCSAFCHVRKTPFAWLFLWLCFNSKNIIQSFNSIAIIASNT